MPGLANFFAQHLDRDAADSLVGVAGLAINRFRAAGSALALEQHWYPSTHRTSVGFALPTIEGQNKVKSFEISPGYS